MEPSIGFDIHIKRVKKSFLRLLVPYISITAIVPPPSSVPTACGPKIIQAHLYERSRAVLS